MTSSSIFATVSAARAGGSTCDDGPHSHTAERSDDGVGRPIPAFDPGPETDREEMDMTPDRDSRRNRRSPADDDAGLQPPFWFLMLIFGLVLAILATFL